jgi:hypothetical protein
MKVTFRGPALAALCNSQRRLGERWGTTAGHVVGRRLLELAAVDADHLGALPGATVETDEAGLTTISFGSIVIEGEITRAASPAMAPADADALRITRVAVEPGDER